MEGGRVGASSLEVIGWEGWISAIVYIPLIRQVIARINAESMTRFVRHSSRLLSFEAYTITSSKSSVTQEIPVSLATSTPLNTPSQHRIVTRCRFQLTPSACPSARSLRAGFHCSSPYSGISRRLFGLSQSLVSTANPSRLVFSVHRVALHILR